MGNSYIVHFVIDDEVLEAIGKMEVNRAHEVLEEACEWFILNKAPMRIENIKMADMVPTSEISGDRSYSNHQALVGLD